MRLKPLRSLNEEIVVDAFFGRLIESERDDALPPDEVGYIAF
jgi:hypothetical protein